MDRGTKIYALILGLVTLTLAFVFLYESPKVSELNDQLESIRSIKEFPYHFKVLRIENHTAVMSTPRSTDVPVARILGILFPQVKGLSTQSADFQKAQKKLATVQNKARLTVIADKEINKVRWELDRSWLLQHGISI